VSDRGVTDETILAGFANLHQVITTGFDAVRAEMSALRTELRSEFQTGLGALEGRMMRRFDRIDDRLEDHERRIRAIEAPP
jgi:hypothetical protein